MKKLSKTLTYVALAIGLFALILMGLMWGKGDAEVASNAGSIQAYTLDPLFILTYALVGIAILIVLIFIVISWAKNPKSFFSSLIYIGVIALIGLTSYLLMDATPIKLSDGVSSAGDSALADFGLWCTYILSGLAIISVLAGSIIKSIR